VAVKDGQIIGHILFTPATIETAEGSVEGMGLAPMAVLPDFQRQGVGSRLVRSGLDEMMQGQHPFVIVLGHPHYYPRFGFVPASRYEIVCEYENVPNEAFMIVVLQDAQVRKLAGVAKYHPEFASGV
jgi:putative acetyltransferase